MVAAPIEGHGSRGKRQAALDFGPRGHGIGNETALKKLDWGENLSEQEAGSIDGKTNEVPELTAQDRAVLRRVLLGRKGMQLALARDMLTPTGSPASRNRLDLVVRLHEIDIAERASRSLN